MRSEIVRFDKNCILPFSVLSLTRHYNLHSTVLFRPGTFGLGDLHYIVMCIRIHRARFQGSTMQVRGWYRYKQPESGLPVSSTSNSEYGREKNRLAFVIDPASPETVEDRNAIKGRDRLEDPGDGAHKNRSFL